MWSDPGVPAPENLGAAPGENASPCLRRLLVLIAEAYRRYNPAGHFPERPRPVLQEPQAVVAIPESVTVRPRTA